MTGVTLVTMRAPRVAGGDWNEDAHPRGEGGKFEPGGRDPGSSQQGASLEAQYAGFTLAGDLQREVESYSGSAQGFNQQLRDGNVTAEMQTRVDRLDQAIKDAPAVAQDTTVYRGLQSDPELEPGSTVTDPGYWSTSTDQTTANGFSGGVMMEIRMPAGSDGLWIPGVTQHGGLYAREQEMVLPRGTQINVLDKVKGDGPWDEVRYVVEVVA